MNKIVVYMTQFVIRDCCESREVQYGDERNFFDLLNPLDELSTEMAARMDAMNQDKDFILVKCVKKLE